MVMKYRKGECERKEGSFKKEWRIMAKGGRCN